MNIYPENSIILAPLSGYTDLPYRHSARRFGCKYCFTEMIDAGSLAYGNAKTTRFMDRAADEEWLGVQLVGCNHDRITKAVDILNQHDFDILDFNLGCPVPKVSKKGAGAALGVKVDEAVVNIPVHVLVVFRAPFSLDTVGAIFKSGRHREKSIQGHGIGFPRHQPLVLRNDNPVGIPDIGADPQDVGRVVVHHFLHGLGDILGNIF